MSWCRALKLITIAIQREEDRRTVAHTEAISCL